MFDDTAGAAVFSHKNNIKVGQGRVLWASATTDISGVHHPQGWVLPGGARTSDSARAHSAAVVLDALSRQG